MDIRQTTINTTKVLLPLLLGGAILYWMYRDYDMEQFKHIMHEEMDWTWMFLSLPFGVTAQLFRGLRWKQTLSPIGEHARSHTSICAVFLSYATSLVIPRVGEFLRCGILKRYDNVTFAKSLGTVVTERAVDSLVVLLITMIAILSQVSVFHNFFITTGTRFDTFFGQFTTTGYIVTLICLLAAMLLLWLLAKAMKMSNKLKDTLCQTYGMASCHCAMLTMSAYTYSTHWASGAVISCISTSHSIASRRPQPLGQVVLLWHSWWEA